MANKPEFAERCVSRSVRSPIGTPHDRGVGNTLAEEGGKVWANSTRVWPRVASLLSVRGADRDVKGCVGVAQGRGEHIRRPQVSARDKPRDLYLSRTITRLSCCVYQRSDRVVSTRSLAYRATSPVGRAPVSRDPFWQAAQARVRKA